MAGDWGDKVNALNMCERNLKLDSEWTTVTSPSAVLGASSCTINLYLSFFLSMGLGGHWEQIQPRKLPVSLPGAPVVERWNVQGFLWEISLIPRHNRTKGKGPLKIQGAAILEILSHHVKNVFLTILWCQHDLRFYSFNIIGINKLCWC